MNDVISKKVPKAAHGRQNRSLASHGDQDSGRGNDAVFGSPTIFRQASCTCGGGCPSCQSKTSLNVSKPNDPAEIEADAIAEKVMRMPLSEVSVKRGSAATTDLALNSESKIQRKCDDCDDDAAEKVMRKEAFVTAGDTPPETPSSVRSVLSTDGQPLEPGVRAFFEPRFDMDFGRVRVLTDSTAAQSAKDIDAKAFTHGGKIVFGAGEYRPETEGGRQLIAHELAHIAQGVSGDRHDNPSVLNRKVDVSSDAKRCETITKHEYYATVNDSQSTPPNFHPRKYHVLTDTRTPLGNDLQVGKELDIRLIDTSGSKGTFLGVCDSIPGILPTPQLLYIPIQYVTPEKSASPENGDIQSEVAPEPRLTPTRDPIVDQLYYVIQELPHALSERGVAEKLYDAAPTIDLGNPLNYEPLMTLLDSTFGPGFGTEVLVQLEFIQTSMLPQVSTGNSPDPQGQSIQNPADDIIGDIDSTPPQSMTGTQLETEIGDLRYFLEIPALDAANPETVPEEFEPDEVGQAAFLRLLEIEAEYFDRRKLSDKVRETLGKLADEQRQSGISLGDAISVGTKLINPATAPLAIAEAGSLVAGKPIEDFVTGFLPGLLAGAVIEMPRDAFQKFDAETREHWILFNAGLTVGLPMGAVEGILEMIIGLYELGKLAFQLSPVGMAWSSAKDAYHLITDPSGFTAEKQAEATQRQEIANAIADLVVSMFKDPAFLIEHGRELGEIAGRAAGRWFNDDFMKRSTFDKGYAIGKVEGRIIFEIAALFLGPEEWFARGAIAVGEFARLSGPLRKLILSAIEKIPLLKLLLEAKNAARAERAAAKGGEVVTEAARFGDEAAEIGGKLSNLSDEAAEIAKVFDPEDLAEIGPINDDTVKLFKDHPERLRAWAEFPEAAQALKFCESPCWPENITDIDQIKRLDAFVREARAKGIKFSRKKLHDALETPGVNVEEIIAGLEQKVANPKMTAAEREALGSTPDETGIGLEPDSDMNVVDRVPGKASEAQFSGDLGEGLEAAGAGAKKLPTTYAKKFSPAAREELRGIFSAEGEHALETFVNRLELPAEGLAQVEIPTSAGLRRVDRLFKEGTKTVLREVKNYTKAILKRTERITSELDKDISILRQFKNADVRIDWQINGSIDRGFLTELELLEKEWPGRFRLIRGTPFEVVP